MRFPDFVPAKRPEEVDHAWAAAMQSKLDNERYAQKQAQREKNMQTPLNAYQGYTELTDHNPLADAVRGWIKKPTAKIPGGAAKTAANVPPPNIAAPGAASAGITPASSMLPAGSTVAPSVLSPAAMAGSTAAAGGASAAAGGSGLAAGLGAGGALGSGVGVGLGTPAAMGGLTAGGTGLAAAGGAGAAAGTVAATNAWNPVGWSAMAGLAALSLYGMLS